MSVLYNAGRGQWGFFNVDHDPMPLGVSFFVLKASADETAFHPISSNANAFHGVVTGTVFSQPLIDGNPDAMLLVMQNFGSGVTNLASSHRPGVFYYLPTLSR